MAAQKPVIATKVGGVPEIIDHAQDGFLVEPANIQQLKRAMNTLLLEQDTRRRFAQNARRKVINQFSIETMIHSLDNLYDMLLSRAHHRTCES